MVWRLTKRASPDIHYGTCLLVFPDEPANAGEGTTRLVHGSGKPTG